MAVETLQVNTMGTVKDVTSSGSNIVSSLENLGLNVGTALAAIGVTKLAQNAGVGPTTLAQQTLALQTPQGVAVSQAVSQQNLGSFLLVVVVVGALAGVFLLAHRQRKG